MTARRKTHRGAFDGAWLTLTFSILTTQSRLEFGFERKLSLSMFRARLKICHRNERHKRKS